MRPKRSHVKIPIVVRMEGTNVEEGKRLFKESGLKITTAENLEEAAEKVVEARESEWRFW